MSARGSDCVARIAHAIAQFAQVIVLISAAHVTR